MKRFFYIRGRIDSHPLWGPFVLARTVVLVSALALLGYLPAVNPLTAP